MRAIALLALATPLLAGGMCTSEDGVDPPVTNPGFATPTALTHAHDLAGGQWTDVGEADWSCLGTASDDRPSTQPIALSGTIRDYQLGDGLGAMLAAFPHDASSPRLGQALANGRNCTGPGGDYAMTVAALPAGETRIDVVIDAMDALPTRWIGLYLEPTAASQLRDFDVFSTGTLSALPAFIGVTRPPGDALAFGSVHDCAGRRVSNAIVTVSATAGTAAHVADASTFYFSAGSTSLPVRREVAPATRGDGQFLVLGLAPRREPAFLQAWGFPGDTQLAAGKLALLAEVPIPVDGDTVSAAALEPRRGGD